MDTPNNDNLFAARLEHLRQSMVQAAQATGTDLATVAQAIQSAANVNGLSAGLGLGGISSHVAGLGIAIDSYPTGTVTISRDDHRHTSRPIPTAPLFSIRAGVSIPWHGFLPGPDYTTALASLDRARHRTTDGLSESQSTAVDTALVQRMMSLPLSDEHTQPLQVWLWYDTNVPIISSVPIDASKDHAISMSKNALAHDPDHALAIDKCTYVGGVDACHVPLVAPTRVIDDGISHLMGLWSMGGIPMEALDISSIQMVMMRDGMGWFSQMFRGNAYMANSITPLMLIAGNFPYIYNTTGTIKGVLAVPTMSYYIDWSLQHTDSDTVRINFRPRAREKPIFFLDPAYPLPEWEMPPW